MKRLALVFCLLSLPAFAADTTEEKLDLILEKLEKIEETYEKILETSEAFNELFSGDLFSKSEDSEASTGDVEKAVEDALNDAINGATSNAQEVADVPVELTGKNFLEVTDWSASDGGSNYSSLGKAIKISVTIKNISDKKIAIVDGHFDVEDKLEKEIMRFSIDSDLNLAPNETHKQSGAYDSGMQFSGDMKRLLTINPNLVVFNLDIKQILFEDGTQIKFE